MSKPEELPESSLPHSILENPNRTSENVGSPSTPFYIKIQTGAEFAQQQDDYIRDQIPFKGQWQTYLNGNDLMIPNAYHHLLEGGGVITNGTENQLLLFGRNHWQRMIRVVSAQLGLNASANDNMRWLYSRHHDFKHINKDGSITIPDELIEYAHLRAGLTKGKGNVIIVGMLFYGEIHDKKSYDNLFTEDKIQALNNHLQ